MYAIEVFSSHMMKKMDDTTTDEFSVGLYF